MVLYLPPTNLAKVYLNIMENSLQAECGVANLVIRF